ncbi:hypothetical protein [Cryobacterium sp. 5I3]|uniref:hypothetical protein n=1 Tax=Cryobacterium sp. 5I3 TaxID=3048592 RepID=UPI002B237334|nr:hypothetical protein [Cryobacterium sp. 5I3]
MSDLAAETDDPKIDPLIAASLDTCATVSAWMGALREHPGAMALTDASFVTTALVGVVCVQHSTTATCKDAAAQGIAG